MIASERIHPHNLDAEKAVLGTFFLNERAVVEVQGLLAVADFYDPCNQAIYSAVLALVRDDKPVDPMLLMNALDAKGELEKVGGMAYITGLEQYVISPNNVMHHAGVVKEKSDLRRLINVAASVADDALGEHGTADHILAKAENALFQIMAGKDAKEFRSVADCVDEVYHEIEERSDNKGVATGVTTGLHNVDELTGGLQKSDLIILAARPSVGKTSLALNIAYAAAMQGLIAHEGRVDGSEPAGVAIFSLEMSYKQLITRLACTKASVRMDLVRKNRISPDDQALLADTMEDMKSLPIWINDTPGLNSAEMRAQAQRLKTKHPNIALIIIDYLQLMSGNIGRENRQQEVSEISRALKALARDLDVPVLALSQLSRGVEHRKGKDAKPRLADLRDSGAIEQDADVVAFLHRVEPREATEGHEAEHDSNTSKVHRVDMIFAKQRNGPIGTCQLLFREDYTQFVPLAPQYNQAR